MILVFLFVFVVCVLCWCFFVRQKKAHNLLLPATRIDYHTVCVSNEDSESMRSCLVVTFFQFRSSSLLKNTRPSTTLNRISTDTKMSLSSVDLSMIEEELSIRDERCEVAYKNARKFKSLLNKYHGRAELHLSDRDPLKEEKEVESELYSLLKTCDAKETPRIAGIGYRIGDYIQYKANKHFLLEEKLISLADLVEIKDPEQEEKIFNVNVRDDEYLSGLISFTHDLSKNAVRNVIAIGTSTASSDTEQLKETKKKILMSRNLVNEFLGKLLEFDFRNGPLRKKYDGLKYALKKLETILYELSIVSPFEEQSPSEGNDVDVNTPDKKRIKTDSEHHNDDTKASSEFINDIELSQIQKRMEMRDLIREKLIKKARDGQKSAKNTIFALHANNLKRASDLTTQTLQNIHELRKFVEQEPSLRTGGSYTGVLEEYVEAKLFASWLESDGSKIMSYQEFLEILSPSDEEKNGEESTQVQVLTPEEYLGGLCDLTGEIGRYAVKMGTSRNTEKVQNCLDTNSSILHAIQSLKCNLPSYLGKKIGPLKMSVDKLEHILYELTLLKLSGGHKKSVGFHGADNEKQEDLHND